MYIDLYVCIHATVISGSRDKMMKLFDLSSGMEIRQFKGHVGRVLCCAVTVIIDYAPVTLDPIKRTLVATGSWDRSIKVCVCVCVCVCVWSWDRSIKVWGLETKEVRVWV